MKGGMEVPLKCCVFTSNLGSAGEDSTRDVFREWLDDTKGLVKDNKVDVLCLHLQEIGGKAYDGSFNDLLAKEVAGVYEDAVWCSGLMMHMKNDAHFTAVASVLLIGKHALGRVQIYDFTVDKYVDLIDGKETLAPSPKKHFICRKFVDAGVSRKGWVHYNLRIDSYEWTLVAVHLYHDEDNWVTYNSEGGKGPSAKRRSNALRESVDGAIEDRLKACVGAAKQGMIVGGDMNFRLDGRALVEKVKKRRTTAEVEIGKKVFSWGSEQEEVDRVYRDNWRDFESSCQEAVNNMALIEKELSIQFKEEPVTWPPSYPLKVKAQPPAYSMKRLPAWADRILYTHSASLDNLVYRSIDSSLDHSLVYLMWDSSGTGPESTGHTASTP